MIRLIWRGWQCFWFYGNYYCEWVQPDRTNYRGCVSLGPFAIDIWRVA
jgi:hypothetical protein